MSFNRTSYDSCAYDLQMTRSVAPGDYRLYGLFSESGNQCYSLNGPVGSKADVSTVKNSNDLCFGSMAEVESDLSWRNNKLNKCNEKVFNTYTINDKPVCSSELTPQDTRFTNPLDNYRGMSLTDLMVSPYLYSNPQCYIQESRDLIGSNTRLDVKDCYAAGKTNNFYEKCDAFPIDNNATYVYKPTI
jgi:hypothetical protein